MPGDCFKNLLPKVRLVIKHGLKDAMKHAERRSQEEAAKSDGEVDNVDCELIGLHRPKRASFAPLPRKVEGFSLPKPAIWQSEEQGAPAGSLISDHLVTTRAAKAVAEQGLSVINRVHGVVQIQHVPIITWEGASSAYLQLNRTTGVPEMIVLPARPRHPRSSLIHEIGHLIDYTAAGAPNRSSATHDLLWEHWRGALRETNHMRALGDLERRTSGEVREAIRYNMRLEEAWARSYVQYIAVQSNREPVLDELASFMFEERENVPVPRQWFEDDFVDLQVEIYEILRNLGGQR